MAGAFAYGRLFVISILKNDVRMMCRWCAVQCSGPRLIFSLLIRGNVWWLRRVLTGLYILLIFWYTYKTMCGWRDTHIKWCADDVQMMCGAVFQAPTNIFIIDSWERLVAEACAYWFIYPFNILIYIQNDVRMTWYTYKMMCGWCADDVRCSVPGPE